MNASTIILNMNVIYNSTTVYSNGQKVYFYVINLNDCNKNIILT